MIGVGIGVGDVVGAIGGDLDRFVVLVVGSGVEAFGEVLLVSVVLGFKALCGDRLRERADGNVGVLEHWGSATGREAGDDIARCFAGGVLGEVILLLGAEGGGGGPEEDDAEGAIRSSFGGSKFSSVISFSIML